MFVIDDIRVVVVLTDANPELLQEFAGVSPRARAERLRALATLGLSVSRGGLQAPLSVPQISLPAHQPQPQAERPASPMRRPRTPPSVNAEEKQAPVPEQPAPSAIPVAPRQPGAKGRNSTLARFVKSLS